MKVCSTCKINKDISSFHKNPKKKDGVQSKCKDCCSLYHREHYLKNKQKYVNNASIRRMDTKKVYSELKSKLKCVKCGENHPACLDFHHTDPTTKEYSIARMAGEGRSMVSIKKEMDKCIVLCANCHRKIHNS